MPSGGGAVAARPEEKRKLDDDEDDEVPIPTDESLAREHKRVCSVSYTHLTLPTKRIV